MWEVIIGVLISIGVGRARNWVHWSKVETVAKAIVQDPANPITDPKAALAQAVILANQARIDKQGAKLGERLELANQRAEIARENERADPHDVELVPRDGTEEFRSPWSDGGGK